MAALFGSMPDPRNILTIFVTSIAAYFPCIIAKAITGMLYTAPFDCGSAPYEGRVSAASAQLRSTA